MPTHIQASERRGSAMGSTFHIVATGGAAMVDPFIGRSVQRLAELEQRWSRFLPTSEVSKLNAAPGTTIQVSADTITLVQKALEARELSGGRFDPTLLQAMHANGYDRTFVSIRPRATGASLDQRRIGLGEITIDHAAGTITLGPTTGFDPGGIGKGLAADLIAAELVGAGAPGAMVNVGGDIRCLGEGPADGAWVIAVGDHVAGVENQVVELAAGGVATSTTARRRWRRSTPDGVADSHHLVDPTTGRSSDTAADLVTVIAASCADAEWIATAIAAQGELPADRSFLGDAAVLLTNHRGEYSVAGSPERFLR